MTCPAHDRVQKPMRVNREEPPSDLKGSCEQADCQSNVGLGYAKPDLQACW